MCLHTNPVTALKQDLGVSMSACMAQFMKADIDDYTGVFCPSHFFCGLDLVADNTKKLKFPSPKECIIFAKSQGSCDQLKQKIDHAGTLV